MALAPTPNPSPERGTTSYQSKLGSNTARRGTLRFEEGIGTDTDVPNDFVHGAADGYVTAPGRVNRNGIVWDKPAADTMRERAHVGSAAWIDSNDMLNDFAASAFTGYTDHKWEEVTRDGGKYSRHTPAIVQE
jgi:hypothetical protein